MNRFALLNVACFVASLWACDAVATATLQGRVYALDSGQPLQAVNVQVYSCDTTGDGPCTQAFTASDNDGRFTLIVAAGTLDISLYAGYDSDYLNQFQNIDIADGETVAVAYYMELGGSISGTVRRASDASTMANVFIDFNSPQNMTGAQTDANGYYELHQVKVGTYTANSEAIQSTNLQQQWYSGHAITPPSQGDQLADSIVVTAGQRTSGIDFNLAAGAMLSGTVKDRYTGIPLNDASFYLTFYDAQNTSAAWFFSVLNTDENGAFNIVGLPSGNVTMSVQNGSPYYTPYVYGCGDRCDPSYGSPIALASATVTDIAFSLQPGGVVAGRVVTKNSGTPIPGALVTVFQAPNGESQEVLGTALTDTSGNFAVENLSGYNYPSPFAKVSGARLNDTVFINQIYGGYDCAASTCTPTGVEPFVPIVADGVSPNINFQLDEGGEITGDSTAYAGYVGPLDVYMELFDANGTFDSGFFTDHTGHFESDGLSPGTYYLISNPALGTELPCMIYELISCTSGLPPSAGTPIVVPGTDHVSINVPLYSELIFGNGFE